MAPTTDRARGAELLYQEALAAARRMQDGSAIHRELHAQAREALRALRYRPSSNQRSEIVGRAEQAQRAEVARGACGCSYHQAERASAAATSERTCP